jgi:hypothetical protein
VAQAILSPLNHARPAQGLLFTLVLRVFPLVLPLGWSPLPNWGGEGVGGGVVGKLGLLH